MIRDNDERPVPRVLTNTRWFDGPGDERTRVEPVRVRGGGAWLGRLRNLMLWRYDAVVLNIDRRRLLTLCAVKKLLPFLRCPLVSVDLILTKPRGWRGYPAFLLRRWLLKEVDLFLLYFRDTGELRRVYGIPAGRVRYIPFKVNQLEHVLSLPSTDDGFFLACGRSNRDYGTLCRAFEGLPYRCRILAPWAEAETHGTRFTGEELPENVEMVSDDGTPQSWNAWIARATAVILPIEPGMMSPSGIGTYLVAMALGKPVVITDSPSTRGILDDGQALVIPPRDAEALRDAVTRLGEDAGLRGRVGAAGRAYALSLGGEGRLARDVLHELNRLLRREPVAGPADTPAVRSEPGGVSS